MKICLIITSLLVISSKFYAQNNFSIEQKKRIDTIANEIDRTELHNFKIIRDMNFENSSQGTENLFFIQNNVLKKIESIGYGETGKAVWKYYYYQNKIIRINIENVDYQKSIYQQNNPIIKKKDTIVAYVNDDKVIQLLHHNKFLDSKILEKPEINNKWNEYYLMFRSFPNDIPRLNKEKIK